MTTAENTFPKVAGDPLFASEANYQVGDFIFATAGEAITAGNVVYIKQSDGKIYKSDTGTADDIRATGIAPAAINNAATGVVQTSGIFTTAGLTASDTYYLGATGAISTTRSGVQVGYAVTTTQLNICIIQDDRDAVGTVKAYLKDFTNIPANNLTAFWVVCGGAVLSDAESPLNGQTLPDLNTTQRFLRGKTSSGTTGGADSFSWAHAHSSSAGVGTAVGQNPDSATNSQGGTQSLLPAYYEVVWIIKIK